MVMKMIGRVAEQDLLKQCCESPRPEFLVVYGRRRVGKTYLIKEYFNNSFSFYATGLAEQKTRQQLRAFSDSLRLYGHKQKSIPTDWYEAFFCLREILTSDQVQRDAASGKRVVFLDEVPWMDTARSDFRSALDYFWNSWASSQKDLLLIVCGSATSWIIDHLVSDRGSFYNRITRQIHLQPFTLSECRDLLDANGMVMTQQQMLESYMVFGGIPYYLNCLDRRLSLAQNIDALCFQQNGQLYWEYDRLYHSLFKNAEKHLAIIETISASKGGLTRKELVTDPRIGDGEPLTKALRELEQCGFIRKYKNYMKEKQGFYYQLIDPFTLFCLRFRQNSKVSTWLGFINTPAYYAWCGNAFEMVCLLHIHEIKKALGISGVETTECGWRSTTAKPAAQIDLLIDRADGIINVCEMKYTLDAFDIDAAYEGQLRNKLNAFIGETEPRKAVHLTMVCASGLKPGKHTGIVQNVLSGFQLF